MESHKIPWFQSPPTRSMYLLRIYIVIHWLLLCTPQFLVQPGPGSKDQKVDIWRWWKSLVSGIWMDWEYEGEYEGEWHGIFMGKGDLISTWWLIPRLVSELVHPSDFSGLTRSLEPCKSLGWTNPLTIRGMSHQVWMESLDGISEGELHGFYPKSYEKNYRNMVHLWMIYRYLPIKTDDFP